MLHMLTLILPKCHRDMLRVLLVFLKRVSSFAGTWPNLANLMNVIGLSVLFPDDWVHLCSFDLKGRMNSTGSHTSSIYPPHSPSGFRELLKNLDQFLTVPEEFLPLLQDQDLFASSLELSSKDFMKQCETYMRIKFGGPAAGSVRIR